MKLIYSLFFLVLATHHPGLLSVHKSKNAQSLLLSWEDHRRLTWEDFNGTPTKGSPFAAECNWEIKYSYSYNENRKQKLAFEVDCYFNKSKSWVKIGQKSSALLVHEQVHFDIAEQCARRLRKKLSETNFSKKDFKTQINKVFDSILQECDSLQISYDEESNHGLIKKNQQAWVEKVDQSIRELDAFQNSEVYAYKHEETRSLSFLDKLFERKNR